RHHAHILTENGFQTPTHFRDFGDPNAVNHLGEGVTEMMAHLDKPGLGGESWCEAQFERLVWSEMGVGWAAQGAQLVSYHGL
ncbi:MAG: hypothetical protein KDI79_15485, partial [Anaerolineae bacterium]|nr:hypothetical protein [Anaerolineae bacterium]